MSSEDIAQLLIRAGFPAVVAIHSETPVLEDAAKVFNQNFLKHLLEGEPLGNSFESARDFLGS